MYRKCVERFAVRVVERCVERCLGWGESRSNGFIPVLRNTEVLVWFEAEQRVAPTDELVLLMEGDHEIWIGFHDGDVWRHDTGVICQPVFWAAPKGPRQFLTLKTGVMT